MGCVQDTDPERLWFHEVVIKEDHVQMTPEVWPHFGQNGAGRSITA